MTYDEGVKVERARCAAISEALASGQWLDLGKRRMPLGSMEMNPVAAQRATALAIAAAIRGTDIT